MTTPSPLPAVGLDDRLLVQPFSIKAWHPVFMAMCHRCEPKRPVLVPGMAPALGVCEGCGLAYQVVGVVAQPGQEPTFQARVLYPKAASGQVTP